MLFRVILVIAFSFSLLSCDANDPLVNVDADRLRERGLDPAIIGPLLTEISQGSFGNVESLVIRRNDVIAIEAYFRGVNRGVMTDLYGVTNSITSLLTGIAINDSLISRDSLVSQMLPDYQDEQRDQAFENITIDHLLDMRSGFAWNETDTPYYFFSNPRNSLENSRDWIQFIMGLEFAFEPGEAFGFNSGNGILLTGAMATAADTTLDAYAKEKLFEPLGIEDWIWRRAQPIELYNGSWGLFLLPTDLTKIGQMMLDGGMYDGKQVVPSEWISEIFEPSHLFSDGSGYNDLWWLGKGRENVTDDFVAYARGDGGQFMYVVPSLDLVIVTTGSNFVQITDMKRMLWEYIFPAML